MNVSPNELRKETVGTLKVVDAAIDSVKLGPRDRAADVTMATLLSARAQCLNTLVLLNDKR